MFGCVNLENTIIVVGFCGLNPEDAMILIVMVGQIKKTQQVWVTSNTANQTLSLFLNQDAPNRNICNGFGGLSGAHKGCQETVEIRRSGLIPVCMSACVHVRLCAWVPASVRGLQMHVCTRGYEGRRREHCVLCT